MAEHIHLPIRVCSSRSVHHSKKQLAASTLSQHAMQLDTAHRLFNESLVELHNVCQNTQKSALLLVSVVASPETKQQMPCGWTRLEERCLAYCLLLLLPTQSSSNSNNSPSAKLEEEGLHEYIYTAMLAEPHKKFFPSSLYELVCVFSNMAAVAWNIAASLIRLETAMVVKAISLQQQQQQKQEKDRFKDSRFHLPHMAAAEAILAWRVDNASVSSSSLSPASSSARKTAFQLFSTSGRYFLLARDVAGMWLRHLSIAVAPQFVMLSKHKAPADTSPSFFEAMHLAATAAAQEQFCHILARRFYEQDHNNKRSEEEEAKPNVFLRSWPYDRRSLAVEWERASFRYLQCLARLVPEDAMIHEKSSDHARSVVCLLKVAQQHASIHATLAMAASLTVAEEEPRKQAGQALWHLEAVAKERLSWNDLVLHKAKPVVLYRGQGDAEAGGGGGGGEGAAMISQWAKLICHTQWTFVEELLRLRSGVLLHAALKCEGPPKQVSLADAYETKKKDGAPQPGGGVGSEAEKKLTGYVSLLL